MSSEWSSSSAGALAEAGRLGSSGDWQSAETILEAAIQRDELDPKLWLALGEARYRLARRDASAAFEKACALQPESAMGQFMWGTALLREERPAAAIAPLLRAVSLAPDHSKIHLHLGVAYAQERCWALAARAMTAALSADPSEQQATDVLNLTRHSLSEPVAKLLAYAADAEARGYQDEAEAICRIVLERDPGNARARWMMATKEIGKANWKSVIELLDPIRPVDDIDGIMRMNAASAYHNIWDLNNSSRLIRSVLQTEKSSGMRPMVLERYLFEAAFDTGISHEAIAQFAGEWVQSMRRAIERPLAPPVRPRNGRKLRIGYLWSMFGHPIELPFIARHDRTKYALYAYAFGGRTHADTPSNVERFDAYRRIDELSDADAALLIFRDEIDLLIDLGGQGQHQRNPIQHRPAPVQIGYGNKFFSTRSDRIDWLIVNPGTVMPGDEAHYVERIYTLPGTFVQCELTSERLAPVRSPCQESSFVTIGSPASLFKVNCPSLDFWTSVLERVPDAILSLSFSVPPNASLDGLDRYFAARGVPRARYRLNCHDPGGFLAYLNTLDLALDSTPFSANFSAYQTLAQGVPLVATNGDRYTARLAAGLLSAIGRDMWIGRDIAEAVEIGVALATDRERLAAEREKLPLLLQSSGVLDATAYARAMEQAYEAMFAQASDR